MKLSLDWENMTHKERIIYFEGYNNGMKDLEIELDKQWKEKHENPSSKEE